MEDIEIRSRTIARLMEMVNERDREIAKLKAASQSAPAGEREAFEQLWEMRGADDEGNPGTKPLRSEVEPRRYRGSAAQGSWVWFQRGASWQRTQAAKVPEGWKLMPPELAELMLDAAHELYGTNERSNASDDEIARLFWHTLLAAAPAQPAVHPDDAAVDRFAAAMKAKLAKAREKGRGGWDDPAQCSVEFLAKLLVKHLTKGNAGTFEDVANFAMMLHQRGADPKVLAREASAEAERLGAANEKLCARIKQLKAEPAAHDQGEGGV